VKYGPKNANPVLWLFWAFPGLGEAAVLLLLPGVLFLHAEHPLSVDYIYGLAMQGDCVSTADKPPLTGNKLCKSSYPRPSRNYQLNAKP